MKKATLLFAMLLTVIGMSAKERTESEIRNIAVQTLHQFNSHRKGAAAVNYNDLKVFGCYKAFTVMGSQDNGFVIVANDDAFSPVLGYSDGVYDIDTNDGLSWYVHTLDLSMQSAIASVNSLRSPIIPSTDPVMPLLNSTWDQGAPFNSLCPKTSKGKHYPCGCVATALGQIMNYYKYPTQGHGEKQYSFKPAEGVGELLYANFGETTYDWANVLDDYNSVDYTEEQEKAVATLILHCGVSVEMQYTPSGSGAYSSEAHNGLINYFGYHKNLGQFYRNYYSQEAWMNLIFDELNKQRPIYYSGSDVTQGGHAFVIDGYASNGLVHVNWGWGPNGGNGYYDISLLNPSGYSFAEGQNMILGIAPPTVAVPYESHIVSPNPFSAQVSKIGGKYYLTSISVGTTMWNMCGSTWDGKIGIVMQSSDKTYVLQSRAVNKTANLQNVVTNFSSSFPAAAKFPDNLADGEYRIFVGSMDDSDSNWRLVRRSDNQVSNYIVVVSNGIPVLQSSSDDTWQNVTTAIRSAKVLDEAPTRFFDLQGREVDASTKGLVIRRQGSEVKKIIVK